MGSETETVTVEGIPFPAEITAGSDSNPLSCLPKIRKVDPTGRTPGASPATLQKLAQEESWSNRTHTRRKSCYTPKASPRNQVQRHRHLPPQQRRPAARPPAQLEGQDRRRTARGRRLLPGPRRRSRGEAVPGRRHQGDQGLAVRRAARELRARPPRRRRQVRRRGGGAREGRRLLPGKVLQARLRRHLPLPGHSWHCGDIVRDGGQGRGQDEGGERERGRDDPEVVPRRRVRAVSPTTVRSLADGFAALLSAA